MKNRYWIMLIGMLFLLCAALAFFPAKQKTAGSAKVTSEGKVIHILDLSEDREFTVTVGSGRNTITVKDGKIAVTEADCPDQYCVRQGFCNGGTQIVCLPHKLVISFLGESEIDGAVG